jgi:hypothetical protein
MTPQAYPLAWPQGRPRTPNGQRKAGAFKSNGSALTVSVAAGRVEDEIAKLGGRYLLISSNVEVTLSGRPRSGQREPEDRGVCVYFQLAGKPYAMACDRYLTVADNLAAIAAHVDATRKIERHGVATAAETLQAFQALPAPADAPRVRPWREVMCVPVGFCRPEDVRHQYRVLAAERHPDAPGGSHEKMAELNAARDAALKELGA